MRILVGVGRNAAIKERKPGELMQVVESEDMVEWISALAR
jgi:hypothetical protein